MKSSNLFNAKDPDSFKTNNYYYISTIRQLCQRIYPLDATMVYMTRRFGVPGADPRLPKDRWLKASDHPDSARRADVPSARAVVPGDVLPPRLETDITDGLRRYWGESAVRAFGLELIGTPAGHEDIPPTPSA